MASENEPPQNDFRNAASVNLTQILEDSKNFFKPPYKWPHASPEDWGDQVLYFLMPDRFSDDKEGVAFDPNTDKDNGIKADPAHSINSDADAERIWRAAGKTWVGGTLKGIQRRLGYLQRMGVTAIWVGPVFKQIKRMQTYHGYGIQDFLEVDSNFGTREDLRAFVKAAHDEKIYVILDIILNHAGDVFEYVGGDKQWTGPSYPVQGFRDPAGNATLPFQEQSSGADLDGAVWPTELQDVTAFTRKGAINNWDHDPEYLEGDFFGLKDITLGVADPFAFTPTVALKTLCKAYKYWIAYADIDGFRIDTVKHMGKGPTRYFASAIHEFAQNIGKENFFLVGEVTGGRTLAFDTVAITGLNAALGIGDKAGEDGNDLQDQLEYLPKGFRDPSVYFNLFRDALSVNRDSHAWFRNKVVTMLDDHDQVRKGDFKARFCANDRLEYKSSVLAALAFNLCTLGIPCIYYGSEQQFDGHILKEGDDFQDRFIRESMFGGGFGAFRTKNRHFFNENNTVYQELKKIADVRQEQMPLRRGRQYLREISGDGVGFGLPSKPSNAQMKSIVPWSRVFADMEILCAINTDAEKEITAWVTVDRDLHPDGDQMQCLYSTDGAMATTMVSVEERKRRAVVKLTVPGGGFVIYK